MAMWSLHLISLKKALTSRSAKLVLSGAEGFRNFILPSSATALVVNKIIILS